jgi:serine/threonine-protein kinase
MDAARWDRIQSVFHEAIALPESRRLCWLESACGDDRPLMAEVLAMLEADTRKASLLDRGLPDMANRILVAALDPAVPREIGPYRLKSVLRVK